MAYRQLSLTQKIEQLEVMARGYDQVAEKEANNPVAKHWKHHAEFARDVANDLRQLKDVYETDAIVKKQCQS